MYGNRMEMVCSSSCSDIDYSNALANWAKMELLKEKVKKHMDAKYGAKMDKVAQLIVEVIEERKKSGNQIQQRQSELEDAFEDLYESAE